MWTVASELAIEKIEKSQLLKAERSRSIISDALFATPRWCKCIKLASLLVANPKLISGLLSFRNSKCITDEFVTEMKKKLKKR